MSENLHQSPRVLTEEEAKKFLMSVDPKMIEEIVKQQKEQAAFVPMKRVSSSPASLPRSPPASVVMSSSSSGHKKTTDPRKAIKETISGGLDIEAQMNMALSVADQAIGGGGRSPSLRRVSVETREQKQEQKQGLFKKKKASEPHLVFTFSKDDLTGPVDLPGHQQEQEDVRTTYSQPSSTSDLSPSVTSPTITIDSLGFTENRRPSFTIGDKHQENRRPSFQQMSGDLSRQSLAVQKMLDRAETGSIVSQRSNRTAHSKIVSKEDKEAVKEAKIVKKERFLDFFTMVMSITYGVAIFILSVCIYAMDLLLVNSYETNYSELWNLTLCCVGILLLVFNIVDINNYIRLLNKQVTGSSSLEGIRLVEGPDGELNIEVPLQCGTKHKSVPEYYGFTTGRHAGSFFLKIGAGLFCFGHLVHMCLNMVKHIYSLESTDVSVEKYCGQIEGLVYDVIYPAFSFLQLFFVFKYGNVIVNKNKWLARFAFMHCLVSCVSFWIYTLVNETLDAIVKKYFSVKPVETDCDTNYGDDDSDDHVMARIVSGVVGYAGYDWKPCVRDETEFIGGPSLTNNLRCVVETRAMCNNGANADYIFSISAWLYPFSIEFNILVVGIWFILWTSIGQISEHKDSMEFLPSVTPLGSMEDLHRTEGHRQAMILFADCSSSNKGMFAGVFILVGVIATALIVLVQEAGCDTDISITLGNYLRIVVMIIMIFACLYAYYIIAQFDVNPNPISLLDDMLLFFCLPSFFFYFTICLGSTFFAEDVDYEFFLANLLILVQVVIQTPMIVDGLRRCTNDHQEQKKMRARNVITFLIVANLAVYIMETLLIKSYDYQNKEIEFYGPDAWTVLSHISLPICVFYRFHSAVALVDIWNSAYKSSDNH